jgi:hypothetical protein
MKNSKFRLLKWGSAVLVIAAAICLFLSNERATDTQVVSSPTTQHATITLDPRPEIRVEQLLHLDYFGFDPSLASLLEGAKGTTRNYGSNLHRQPRANRFDQDSEEGRR